MVQLASTTYAGANHTHLIELLRDREGIDLSRPTVRRILTRAGIPSPRHRRPPKHRVRRQRMPQAGILVHIDGSFHRWLGDNGPQFALLRVDSGRGQNRTLRSLSTLWPPVFAGEQDVGPPKG